MREHAAAMTDGAVTGLLRSLRQGDREALQHVIPLVYEELKRMARAQLRRSGRARTLNTTGLVHEAYAKLARHPGLDVKDRGHLLAVTACAMRQVLVDLARARASLKRRGVQVTLDDAAGPLPGTEGLLDLDRALNNLQARHERLARVVECRYFAGLSEEETAEALGVSLRTAQRDWLRARAWLQEELSAGSRT
jgi:RNA polymerase sigma factor (TIGR02999 family)